MKITAGQPIQERDIAADSTHLAVPWQITEGEEILLQGVQGFPLTATVDEVGEFLNKKLVTYKENLALHEGAKEFQAQVDNAEKVAGEITGLEINE